MSTVPWEQVNQCSTGTAPQPCLELICQVGWCWMIPALGFGAGSLLWDLVFVWNMGILTACAWIIAPSPSL